jgi:hypothetical protein
MAEARTDFIRKLSPQQQADVLLQEYQARRRHGWPPPPSEDKQTIIRELGELQELINHLLVKFHAGA